MMYRYPRKSVFWDRDDRFAVGCAIVVLFVSVQMQTSSKGSGKEAKLEIGL